MDRCPPAGSERHMSLPAPYTRGNIAQYFFLLCPFFLLESASTSSLPSSVPFQFSSLFLYFLVLYLLTIIFLLLSVVPNPPTLFFSFCLLFPIPPHYFSPSVCCPQSPYIIFLLLSVVPNPPTLFFSFCLLSPIPLHYFSPSVSCSQPPTLHFLQQLLLPSSHISFFYIFALFSTALLLPFLPLFCLHATYCSVSFVCLFVCLRFYLFTV